MREVQLNLYNLNVKRVLPNGHVIVLDPSKDPTLKFKKPMEYWMEEHSKVKYNRTFPTIVEDIETEKRRQQKKHAQSKQPQSGRRVTSEMAQMISAFAETEVGGEEVEQQQTTQLLSDAPVEVPMDYTSTDAPAALVSAASTSGERARVESIVSVSEDVPGSVDSRYIGTAVAGITPAKELFVDAGTFYEREPVQNMSSDSSTMKKVRQVNNLAKRMLIQSALNREFPCSTCAAGRGET